MDNDKSRRQTISVETVEIVQSGSYIAPTGETIDLAQDLDYAQQQSILYKPNDFSRTLTPPQLHNTQFSFLRVTTLQGAKQTLEQDPELDLAVLNFASAKNPGGGFLKGSQAQEESLARCTGIYHCINNPRMRAFYEANMKDHTCLYTHHIIYSPKVPVFRDDDLRLISKPFKCSFISAPAVNAGHASGRVGAPKVAAVMRERIDRILGVAAQNGHHAILLGAWGCGVFKNEVADVAHMFRLYLNSPDAKYRNTFSRVIFAIPDATCGAFEKYFTEEKGSTQGRNSQPQPNPTQSDTPGKRTNNNNRKTARLKKENVTDDDVFG